MAKYKGKNNNRSTIAKVWNRAQYQSKAFVNSAINDTGEHVSIVNFNFSEMRYYGKIDTESDPVVVDSTKLIALANAGASPEKVNLILPPLKDMFERFQRKFIQAVRLQKIKEDDPYLATPTPYFTFVDPIREYRIYVSRVMDVFNQVFLAMPENEKKVATLSDYVNELMHYLTTMGSDFPITLTGWRKSKKSSLASTGFAISIADLDCSKDSDKEDFILNKNCTQFYYQACKQYGFSISKQCPWVIVADIDGAGSARYMAAHSIGSPRDFFQRFYKKTYTLDIELLKPLIRKSYTDYLRENTFYKEVNICKNDHDKLVYKNIFRSNINKKDYRNQYNIYYWIPYYIKIRNIEDEFPYDEPSIVRMTQKASEFEKILDKDKAMSYINEQFRKKYRYAEGSYQYYKKRLEERQRQRDIRRGNDDISNY